MTSGSHEQNVLEAAASVAAPPDIALRAVRKTFGSVVAVDNLDLDIARGEFFAILGPSGSGKTTVLRMIAGFEHADRGQDRARRGRHDKGAAVPSKCEHGVPGLRPVPAHDRGGERRAMALRVKRIPRGERTPTGRRCTGHGAPRGLRDAKADPALRRPATARRPGPGTGESSAGAAARRTARCARPQTARTDAAGAQGDPARRRHHVRLRHARPGRGADAVRPTRGVQRRDGSSRWARPPRSTSPRRQRSSPASSAPRTWSAARLRKRSIASPAHSSCARRRFGCHPPADAPSEPGNVAVAGTVREIVYAGAQTRIVVDTDVGPSMTAVQLNSAQTISGWQRGDRVMLAWDRAAVRAINP